MRDVRGLSERTIKDFRIGYVPKSVQNEYGNRHECAGRIIFPIFDAYNSLVALSTRDWRENAKMKHWHESFAKSLYLYGLNAVKKWVSHYNLCMIVEGEFDLFSVYNVGLYPVVGTLGTSLNLFQISMLKRYCDNIYLIFDGDEPGRNATQRVLTVSKQHGLSSFEINIIPVYMPEKSDPDSFVRQNGKSSFVSLMREAKKLKEKK